MHNTLIGERPLFSLTDGQRHNLEKNRTIDTIRYCQIEHAEWDNSRESISRREFNTIDCDASQSERHREGEEFFDGNGRAVFVFFSRLSHLNGKPVDHEDTHTKGTTTHLVFTNRSEMPADRDSSSSSTAWDVSKESETHTTNCWIIQSQHINYSSPVCQGVQRPVASSSRATKTDQTMYPPVWIKRAHRSMIPAVAAAASLRHRSDAPFPAHLLNWFVTGARWRHREFAALRRDKNKHKTRRVKK